MIIQILMSDGRARSTADLSPIFTTYQKMGGYSTFSIPKVVLKDIQRLWGCQMYCNHPIFVITGCSVT